MTFPTHLLSGFVVGAITGDYSVAVISAVAPDVDHVISYAKHGVFKSARTFWSVITAEADPWNDQRNILHNVFIFIISTTLVFFLFREHIFAFVLGYGVHLILDAFDASDFYPFFPWKGVNIRGPIHYNSKGEYAIAVLLLILFIVFQFILQ